MVIVGMRLTIRVWAFKIEQAVYQNWYIARDSEIFYERTLVISLFYACRIFSSLKIWRIFCSDICIRLFYESTLPKKMASGDEIWVFDDNQDKMP